MPSGDKRKVSVLLTAEAFERFEAYCRSKGFKKSTLIARLIREHLNQQGFSVQRHLFSEQRGDT